MATTMTVPAPNGHNRLSFETAAQHATRDVPLADPGHRLSDVREMLVGRRYESASHIVVCDTSRFRGVLRIEDALAAPADATVESVMDPHAPIVAPGTDQEVAAWQAVRHQESALSVVDGEGRFVGIIPPHRLVEVLSEHEEDLFTTRRLPQGRINRATKCSWAYGSQSNRSARQGATERRFG